MWRRRSPPDFKHGHQVTLGTRDTGKLKDFLAQHKGAQAASFADAAKFGELVVLAVKGSVGSMRSRPPARRTFRASR